MNWAIPWRALPTRIQVKEEAATLTQSKRNLAGKAVPTLVLGISSRYVHSHYNFCAIEDVEITVRMAVGVIKGAE